MDSNPLSDVSLANMSSSLWVIFILLMVSIAVQKLFSLMFILYFISLVQGDMSEKILLWEMSKILMLMFSSRIFMVSSLTFKHLIYFEFILLCGIKMWSRLIFACNYFSQHHLLNRLSLPHCMFVPPLSNSNWPWRWGFISGLKKVLFLKVSVNSNQENDIYFANY